MIDQTDINDFEHIKKILRLKFDKAFKESNSSYADREIYLYIINMQESTRAIIDIASDKDKFNDVMRKSGKEFKHV
jgi:hypothetical protein